MKKRHYSIVAMALACILAALAIACPDLSAEVTTDGTVGPAVSLTGPNFQIPDSLGTTYGFNLFHSFLRFGLQSGESATFTGPGDIANVISRVTGGEASIIDGLLRSEVGRAAFFFINPAGIVFGENARVDVPAAFHAGTADELQFGDGKVFSARNPEAGTLSVAPVEAFGFTSPQPAKMIINGSVWEFAPESTVSLAGGDIEMTGGEIQSEGGEIRLAAVGSSSGPVAAKGKLPENGTGTLRIEQGTVASTGESGGMVRLDGGTIALEAAEIHADNTGDADAMGGVRVNATDLTVSGSIVTSDSRGDGRSGAVVVDANGSVIIRDGAEIRSTTFSGGDALGVWLKAGSLLIDGGGRVWPSADYAGGELLTGISSEAIDRSTGNAGTVTISVSGLVELRSAGTVSSGTSAKGDAGDILIQAGELKIDGAGIADAFTGIASDAYADARGDAGSVSLTVDGPIEMLGCASISSSTYAAGDAGRVTIQTKDLEIDALGITEKLTGISSSAEPDSTGNAGEVDITVEGLLELYNGGQILSATFAEGNAGSVKVRTGDMKIDSEYGSWYFTTGVFSSTESGSRGRGGEVEVAVEGLLEMGDSARISSETRAEGNAGPVTVTVEGLVEMSGGAIITSSTEGLGDAGDVTVRAGQLTIDGYGTGIFSEAGFYSEGNAGSVSVTVEHLLGLSGGSKISSSTRMIAKGNAGDVTVQAGQLAIEGYDTGIFSEAESNSEGGAGSVSVTIEGLMALSDEAKISSSSRGRGNAGNVTVHANEMKIWDGAGIFSQAGSNSESGAGTVSVTVTGLLEMIDDARVSSNTAGDGDAGNVTIKAGEMMIEGYDSGIFSDAESYAEGSAGPVFVTVDNLLFMSDGARISSSTGGRGDAGDVTIQAKLLKLENTGTGILSEADQYSYGNAGSVSVTVKSLLALLDGARISSSTKFLSRGDAGDVTVRANRMEIKDSGTGIFSQAESFSSGNAGSIRITVDGQIEILDGAAISSGTFSWGDAGSVTIRAKDMKIDTLGFTDHLTGVSSSADSYSFGNAGTIDITVWGLLELYNGAQMLSATFAQGDAGSVTVRAGDLKIDTAYDDYDFITGIFSAAAEDSFGRGGLVEVAVEGLLEMGDSARISSETRAAGNAGDVTVQAGEIKMKGDAGILSEATSVSWGDAGSVTVTVNGLLEMRSGATISTSTNAWGDAGDVTIRSGGLKIDGSAAGIFSEVDQYAFGNAGSVSVNVNDLLEISNGAAISTSTKWGSGNAGNVTIQSGELAIGGEEFMASVISSDAGPFSIGNAGNVHVTVEGLLRMSDRGQISSSTQGWGDAGGVTVRAGDMEAKGAASGVFSEAGTSAFGDAGLVDVAVDNQLALEGAYISSSSFSSGNAGSVRVSADRLVVDGVDATKPSGGIFSKAGEYATGYVGDIKIDAGRVTLKNGGQISIAAEQTLSSSRTAVAPRSVLHLDVDSLELLSNAGITAESTGNVPASEISIRTITLVAEGGSRITTSSIEADGGPITIEGHGLLLKNGLITTSVEGRTGDGGDIVIRADALGLQGGFIQANTAAAGARGGDILVDTRSVIVDGELEVGGSERREFRSDSDTSIIQAAAPGGEQGVIVIFVPELDISGSLVPVSADLAAPIRLANDPCETARGETASSLVVEGRGGLPRGLDAPASVFFEGQRLVPQNSGEDRDRERETETVE